SGPIHLASSATITARAFRTGWTESTSLVASYVIANQPANQPPAFTKGADQTALEDSGLRTVSGWATAISAGPASEAGQTVTFQISVDTPTLFSIQPAVSSVGTLTFTPAANAYGTAVVSVNAKDNGGTANGGVDTSLDQTFVIVVTPVNDAPTFTLGGDRIAVEDAAATSVAGYASAISAGPANETGQVVSFTVSASTSNLFSVAPAIDAAGTLTFTPAPDANGSAVITVVAHDSGGVADGGTDTSVARSGTITITAVNDAPSFTKGADQTVLEDAGAQTVSGWATAIASGPADESAQSVSFTVTTDNAGLFADAPTVSPAGVLSYTPAVDANGVATITVIAHDDGGVANGGIAASAAQRATITVTAVNDAPSFTMGANQSVLEDAGAQSVSGWATAISAGPADEAVQVVSYAVTTDNAALFSAQPAVSAAGVLSYALVADANGVASISVVANDSGGEANGGVAASAAQSATITVTAVNDAPSFAKGADQTVLEDAGAQSVSGWATAIASGPANESGQVVTFSVTTDNDALFAVLPTVSATGVLSYTTAPDATGVATIAVTAHDDGGIANAGVDASAAQTATITVGGINDAPSFTRGADQTVLEDAGAQTVAAWSTAVSAGPANEGSQTVTFTVTTTNGALFAVAPAVAPNGTLSYRPATNAHGVATISVVAHDDGGVANGGLDASAAQSASITVTSVNDAPSFIIGTNQSVGASAGAQSAAGWATGISAGPNEAGQVVDFVVTTPDAALFAVPPAIASNGTLTYTPSAIGTASISVVLHDNGGTANGGVDASAASTFQIRIVAGSGTGGTDVGDPVVPPTIGPVTLTITAGLTGDQVGQLDGQTTSFTKAASITVSASADVTEGTLSSIVVDLSDGTSVTLAGGVGTIPLPDESLWTLTATATAANADGTATAARSSDPVRVLVDRTIPSISLRTPSATWQVADVPEFLPPISTGRNVYLNANTETGGGYPNRDLRHYRGIYAYARAGLIIDGLITDASGLRTGVASTAKARPTISGTLVTLTVTPPAAGAVDPVITISGFAGITAGQYALVTHIEDRCGNVMDADQSLLLVDVTPAVTSFLTSRNNPFRGEPFYWGGVQAWKTSTLKVNRLKYLGATGLPSPLSLGGQDVPASLGLSILQLDAAGNLSAPQSPTITWTRSGDTDTSYGFPQLYGASLGGHQNDRYWIGRMVPTFPGGPPSPSATGTTYTIPGPAGVLIVRPDGSPLRPDPLSSYTEVNFYIAGIAGTSSGGPRVVTVPPSWANPLVPSVVHVEAHNDAIPHALTANEVFSPLVKINGQSAPATSAGGDGYAGDVAIARSGSRAILPGAGTVTCSINCRLNYGQFDAGASVPISVVKLSPDVIATGNRTTITFEAAFLDATFEEKDFDAATGDYVHFLTADGADVTMTHGAYAASTDADARKWKIAIVEQYMVVENGKEKVVMEIEAGSGVGAEIFDVDVKCGAVKAYSDELSQLTAGANGAHRMKGALAVYKTKIQEYDQSGSLADVIDRKIPSSAPNPVVQVSSSSFSIGSQTVTTVDGYVNVAGSLTSGVCDITAGAQGTIDRVEVFLDLGQTPIGTLSVNSTKGSGSLPRKYPYSGSYNGSVAVSALKPGPHSVRVVAKDKVFGKIGYSEFAIEVRPSGQSDPPSNAPGGFQTYQQPITASLDFTSAGNLAALDQGAAVAAQLTSLVTRSTTSLASLTKVAGTDVTLQGQGITAKIDSAALTSALAGTSDVFAVVIDAPSSLYQSRSLTFRRVTAGQNIFSADYYQISLDASAGWDAPIAVQLRRGAGSPIADTVTRSGTTLSNTSGSLVVKLNAVPIAGASVTGIAAKVTSTSLGITDYGIDALESGASTSMFASTNISNAPTSPSDINAALNVTYHATYAEKTQQDDSEDFHLLAIAVEGPEEIIGKADFVLPTRSGERKLIKQNGVYYMATPGGDERETLMLLPPQESNGNGTKGVEDGKEDQNADQGTLAFLEGFGKGFCDAGVNLVTSTGQLIAECAVTIDLNLLSVLRVFPGPIGEFGAQAGQLAGDRMLETYRVTSETARVVTAVIKALNARQLEFEIAYITGDSEKLKNIGMEYSALFEMGSEVMNEMFRAYGAINNSREQGEIFGRVMFECAAIVLPIAKAGKLEVLGKARIMRSIISAIQAAKWYQRLKALGKTIELDAALARCVAFIEKLTTTKMCFVAGTPVHTDHGLLAIETIHTGDHVLSRDPRTGIQRFQRVAATFVTHPTTLYKVVIGACHPEPTSSISSSTTNSEGSDDLSESATLALTCTGTHPFWVIEQNDFVPAEDLRSGEHVLLADGDSAIVMRTEVEAVPDGQSFTTYNFEVEVFHTYFVGSQGVWVHNAAPRECERVFTVVQHVADRDATDLVRAGGTVRARMPKMSWDVLQNTYRETIKGVLNGERVPAGTTGPGFESWMRQKLGGTGGEIIMDPVTGNPLTDVDCLVGNRWMEVKHRSPLGPALTDNHAFVNDEIIQLGNQKKIAESRNQTIELVTNFDLPPKLTDWLKSQGIPWTKIDN
ncbi:MAG: hypothetical protein H0W83_00165, partial [Planctomycetes bacterium]|nr:hypothetical protein [Planctomycetota bacterium]